MNESALHKAVIENETGLVRKLISDQKLIHQTSRLGLTPLELARYLGRKECAALMESSESRDVYIQLKKESSPKPYSHEKFQEIFNLLYLHTLRFKDYDILKTVIKNCPYILRIKSLENSKMAKMYKQELESNFVAPTSIRWINDEIQYGLFAEKEFDSGEWIGEYTGFVRQYFRRHPDTNPYCIHYPTKFWSLRYFMVDAFSGGNEIRFANHSEDANMTPYCLVKNKLLHIVLFTNRKVSQNEELTFNYGPDFWRKRTKRL